MLFRSIDKEIRCMLDVNSTIIDLEFGFNKFRLEEVRLANHDAFLDTSDSGTIEK